MFRVVKSLYKVGVEDGTYSISSIEDKNIKMVIVKRNGLYQGFIANEVKTKLIAIEQTPIVNDLRLLNFLLDKIVGNYTFVKD